jgi:hypothetical protein
METDFPIVRACETATLRWVKLYVRYGQKAEPPGRNASGRAQKRSDACLGD